MDSPGPEGVATALPEAPTSTNQDLPTEQPTPQPPPPAPAPAPTAAASLRPATAAQSSGTAAAGGTAAAVQPPGRAENQALDSEILSIAWPMLLTLAADPIAGLVDTAFMGRLGAAQLAGVGVALSIFNTITKIFNLPLLSVTTSAVASAYGSAASKSAASVSSVDDSASSSSSSSSTGSSSNSTSSSGISSGSAASLDGGKANEKQEVSDAACACVGIALGVGLIQVAVLSQATSFLPVWGVYPGSPLESPTLDFLTVRCLGSPATVMMLTLQGIFRGLQDTRTPLAATLISNVLNVILAPILIFQVGWGVKGAAIATVASQVLPTAFLLYMLSQRLEMRMLSAGTVGRVLSLVKPTGLLVVRTAAIGVTYAASTSTVARSGVPAAAAAHQVAFQVYMACSLLADSLAVAAQALLASALASDQAVKARRVALRVLTLGLGLGTGLGLLLLTFRSPIARLFTADPLVLMYISGVFPLVVMGQPVNAAAFVMDGVVFGAGGFKYSCMTAAAAAMLALPFIFLGEASTAANWRLLWVWLGLLALMAMRGGSLLVALMSGYGPFARMGPALDTVVGGAAADEDSGSSSNVRQPKGQLG